ncbi:ABC-2 type transport system ATP-binding protein [Neorhodopirellula lusitana]|uniref:ABC-2 type transport system ATP-binding protein n=1 Tax=Neorhodopirellula lusitana TaxID=445327 RepID=A0ABY1QHE8_9BACT|nr:ABC transporter ATP-binding protein [Neorhodopirellula lusitana]SMP70782.1 ABC-2 type transport system ATP-binding protein [Neorhodopirellula lusitana]
MISPPTDAITVSELRKSYRRGSASHTALDGITFQLRRGERLAYLGPNGAGKTTMIRCLSGRTRPDSGSIELMGRPANQANARDCVGLVPQEIALYGDLTTRENLSAFGRFHGLTGKTLKQQVQWALQWTGLADRADDLVNTFSGGMKRRINLACGVLHQPEVLLLDEPSVGVDPQSRQRIFAMLGELSSSGTSILLTTHHLDEAETQCDRIVIVDNGRVVATGTFDELVRQTIGVDRKVVIRLDQALRGSGNEPLATTETQLTARPGENHLDAQIHDVAAELPRLIDAVGAAGYGVVDVDVQNPSLHHVFLHLTGHALRDG